MLTWNCCSLKNYEKTKLVQYLRPQYFVKCFSQRQLTGLELKALEFECTVESIVPFFPEDNIFSVARSKMSNVEWLQVTLYTSLQLSTLKPCSLALIAYYTNDPTVAHIQIYRLTIEISCYSTDGLFAAGARISVTFYPSAGQRSNENKIKTWDLKTSCCVASRKITTKKQKWCAFFNSTRESHFFVNFIIILSRVRAWLKMQMFNSKQIES